jgi:hypothetical protein
MGKATGRTNAASKPRVLLANEPRSYRQAIAQVLRTLRPDLAVEETEQASLDRELRRGVPELVICSHATPMVRGNAPAWVELYTDDGPLSFVVIGKERSTVPGIELDDILRIVDRAVSR